MISEDEVKLMDEMAQWHAAHHYVPTGYVPRPTAVDMAKAVERNPLYQALSAGVDIDKVHAKQSVGAAARPLHGQSLDDFLKEKGIYEKCMKAVGDINSTAKGSAARYNAGKAPLHLIPMREVFCDYNERLGIAGATPLQLDALEALSALANFQESHEVGHLTAAFGCMPGGWNECAHVFDYGRRKYDDWNWAKGMLWSIAFGSACRHLLALVEGETHDSESGLPHRGHVYCNVVMLSTFTRTYPEGNDMPTLLYEDCMKGVGDYPTASF